MPSELLTERQGATLVLTLSDPSTRNTLSPQACAAGVETLNIAEADDGVRCVVLRGGGRNFCSGTDAQRLAQARSLGPHAQEQSVERFHGFIEALRTFPKPIIAAVEGAAVDGGFSLALACDLIVAAEDARFAMSYGSAGLSPDGGASWHLVNALPRTLVLQMLWLCEPVKVRDLHRLGVVNTVADSGQAFAEASRMAERLAHMAPNAIASTKELVNQAPGRRLREQLDSEREHSVENLSHPNAGEGLQALFDQRVPRFL